MQFSQFLSYIAIFLIISSASCQEKPVADEIKYPGAVDIGQMSAYYANTLPCKDCPGTYTEIQFYSDSTFLMFEVEIMNDSIPTGTMGRWFLEGRLVVMNLSNGKERYLLYNGNDMLLLDDNKDVIEDDIKYAILRQPNSQLDYSRPFRSKGEFGTKTGIPYFGMCNINEVFPVMNAGKINDAYKMYEERDTTKLFFFIDAVVHFEVPSGPESMIDNNIHIYLHEVRTKLEWDLCND